MEHTKGKWYIERTSSKDGDFQGRILCESSEKKSPHSDKAQVYRIAGEPCKLNGFANIHVEADAKLIAEAGTVATETGKTPRQLADENKELLEAIHYYFSVLKEVNGESWNNKPDHVLSKMIEATNNATK